jgi:hypothetical protein
MYARAMLPVGTRARLGGALVALVALAPVAALAFGGHDSVGCKGCHSFDTPTTDGKPIFDVPPNATLRDPETDQPYTGKTAACLYCHADPDKGGEGYLTVSHHTSHPFGRASVNERVAHVPPELLSDGRFGCLSCHDAHPSNPNYKYSRVDVGPKGEQMDRLCVLCHRSKGGVPERKAPAPQPAAAKPPDAKTSDAKPPDAKPPAVKPPPPPRPARRDRPPQR